MTTTSKRFTRPKLIVAALVVAATSLAAACVPPPSSGGGGSTPDPEVRTVTNASLDWTISAETNHGTPAGQPNYWSAGVTDGTAATYVPTNGNATVLKKNASGTYVAIGSEAAVSYANRGKDGTGATVGTTTGSLGQKVRYTGGTGTVDTATGASTIQWTGTFTINFYGIYVPFWIKDPKLVVDSSGAGTLTATIQGVAASMANPGEVTPLPATSVTLATIPSIGAANSTGFTAETGFLGTAVSSTTGVQVAKTVANQAYWGSWPQSFVTFQDASGLGSYWYSSGGAADPFKKQDPIAVAYNLAP